MIEELQKEVERLNRACEEWAEVSQKNYQSAKKYSNLFNVAHDALYKIAGELPFADDPWDIARESLEVIEQMYDETK